MERPPGSQGILISLFFRLMDLIRTVGVQDVLRWIAFPSKHGHKLLERIGKVTWQRTPRFLWYN